mgnify:FL=1
MKAVIHVLTLRFYDEKMEVPFFRLFFYFIVHTIKNLKGKIYEKKFSFY